MIVDTLIFVSQRPVVIALAVIGALLVTAGGLAAKSGAPGDARRREANVQTPLSRALTLTGYVVTGISVTLFIIAGFVSDLR